MPGTVSFAGLRSRLTICPPSAPAVSTKPTGPEISSPVPGAIFSRASGLSVPESSRAAFTDDPPTGCSTSSVIRAPSTSASAFRTACRGVTERLPSMSVSIRPSTGLARSTPLRVSSTVQSGGGGDWSAIRPNRAVTTEEMSPLSSAGLKPIWSSALIGW